MTRHIVRTMLWVISFEIDSSMFVCSSSENFIESFVAAIIFYDSHMINCTTALPLPMLVYLAEEIFLNFMALEKK